MRAALPFLLLAACDEPAPSDPPAAAPGAAPRAHVAGTLERAEPDGVEWTGFEVVDLTTGEGECGLTREIVATEAEPCDGCGLTLDDVVVTVVDGFDDCGIALEADIPTLGRSVAFRASEDWRVPARGDVLVGAGDAWEPYSSGLLLIGELSYQHRATVGEVRDTDVRDLPDKPVTR